MRSFVSLSLASGAVMLAACGSPPIEDDLAGDNLTLPDRAPSPSPTPTHSGTTTPPTPPPPDKFTLTVTLAGTGTGTIYSTPTGVTCTGTTCKGTFARGTAVTLQSAPAAGSLFTAWSGGPQCTGATACAATLDRDVAVSADFLSFDGTWAGTYTNTRLANGCTFNNAGNLSVATKSTAMALSSTANNTGLELRLLQGCQLVGSTTGAAPSAPLTFTNGTLTGTWTFNVQGANGTLAFPFTAKVTGKKMTGTWTCPTCTGSFTLTKP